MPAEKHSGQAKPAGRFWAGPYGLILITLALFAATAFMVDSPGHIAAGLGRILTSQSLLTTDYIAIGGIGAALLNAVITGVCAVALMVRTQVRPNGAIIMAIWLTIGFSFFGKNVLGMMPIVYGVWLYSRHQDDPFINYSLVALLSTTLSPVVSEFSFSGRYHPMVDFLLGGIMGIGMGFIIPIISSATNRVHGGYNLYNIGFAGGILALFLVAFRKSIGVGLSEASYLSEGNNRLWGIFLLAVMLLWCAFSLLGRAPRTILPAQLEIWEHSGRLVTDYYLLYDENTYFNMGLMGLLGTGVTLALGAQLNGPTLAGIFTMMGFGAFGKHLRNCVPVMGGAILYAFINHAPFNVTENMLPILFSTGLAPVAGQYGWHWGVVAGMLHCMVVSHTGLLTGGLNLYNNGFAAGFVALLIVPVILAFRRGRSVS